MKDLIASLRALEADDPVSAGRLLEQILKAAPRSVDARLMQAQLFLRSGDIAGAARAYDAAAAIAPSSAEILCLLGATWNALGQYGAAFEAYRRAGEKSKGAHAAAMAATMLHRLGRIQDALSIAHPALLRTPHGDPERWGLLRLLTRLLRDGGAPIAAERLQQELLLAFQADTPGLAPWLLARDASLALSNWRSLEPLASLTEMASNYADEASAALAFPDSFVLPAQNAEFHAYAAARPQTRFVFRAAAGPAKTLALVSALPSVADHADIVAQRRLETPLLICGRRAELRIFVLVTSPQPLRAYVYREGLAYLAPDLYETHSTDLARYATFGETPATGGAAAGVLPLSKYWSQAEKAGARRPPIWTRIRSLVAHFLLGVTLSGLLSEQSRAPARAFPPKLFSLDLEIDAAGQPWLMAYRDESRGDSAPEAQLRDSLAKAVFAMTSYCALDDKSPPEALCGLLTDRAAMRKREAALERAQSGEFEPL